MEEIVGERDEKQSDRKNRQFRQFLPQEKPDQKSSRGKGHGLPFQMGELRSGALDDREKGLRSFRDGIG